MTHLSLFTGIGGIDLAAEWAGFTTAGQCEAADYPTKVLEKHWPDVPRWRDVRHITRRKVIKRLYRQGLLYDRTLPVFAISGGIPCQPFSVAGKQKGKGDVRYLWPEMLRVIRELKPRWVLVENVPGILRIAADDICADLEREGYDVGIFDYEAAAVGALHRRERVFFVANCHGISGDAWRPESTRQQRQTRVANGGNDVADTDCERQPQPQVSVEEVRRWSCYSSKIISNTDCAGLQVSRRESTINTLSTEDRAKLCDWWRFEPDVGRVAHGVPARVDRLKALGNAVVPQQIYPLLAAIAKTEDIVDGNSGTN